MCGYYTPYIPGWDNHGMPIESAIIKQHKLDRKKMSISGIPGVPAMLFAHELCRHADDSQFKRLGVIGDWDHPYLTMNPAFEAEEVEGLWRDVQKRLHLQGLKAGLLVPATTRPPWPKRRSNTPEDPCTFHLCEVQGHTMTRAMLAGLLRPRTTPISSSGPPPPGPCRATWPSALNPRDELCAGQGQAASTYHHRRSACCQDHGTGRGIDAYEIVRTL